MPALAPLDPPTFAQALELMDISTATEERYMSTFPAISYDYAPGKPLSENRSYGGHTFAQAMWAASLKFQDSPLCIHEANGYWTQAGSANRPFIYEVKTVSLTRSFALRQVTAWQPTTASEECPFPRADADKEMGPVAFALTCSFKAKELGDAAPGYFVEFDAAKYGTSLCKDPASYPRNEYFTMHSPAGVIRIKIPDYPSIDVRTPDLHEYNRGKAGTYHRRLHIYRAFESPALDSTPDPNLSAAMHAYVSDRSGLSLLLQTFQAAGLGISGSLNHKIIFHVSPEDMALDDKNWYTQELSSPRGGEGRGAIESRIWNTKGVLVATTIQDALFRQPRAKLV